MQTVSSFAFDWILVLTQNEQFPRNLSFFGITPDAAVALQKLSVKK